MDLNQTVQNVTLEKICSIKPYKGAKETKQINLEVSFDGATLRDVFLKALSAVVIQWQNGTGRKNFDKWKNGQRVKIEFKAPSAIYTSPEEALLSKLASMDPKERAKYKKTLLDKIKDL